MLQYKVPQNVGIEDRIVGPLTLKQLIVLAVGIGLSYILFAILSRFYELNILEYIIIGIPAAIAAAAALIKVNDITFTKYLLLALEYSIKPKKRIWDHRGIAALVAVDITEAKSTAEPQKVDEDKKPVNLESLGRILDSGGFEHVAAPAHKDLDKAEDDLLLPQAFFGAQKDATQNMYWRTAGSHKKRLEILAKISSGSPQDRARQAEVLTEHIESILEKADKQVAATATLPMQSTTTETTNPQKRKRNKKRDITPPARPGMQINTLSKNQPASYSPQGSPATEPPAQEPPNEGEFDFEELKQGEIEINLD